MACIYKRKNRDGSVTWRLVVRRKDVPVLCLAFITKADALTWVKQHELRYIKNPKPYLKRAAATRLEATRTRRHAQKYG